MRVIYKKVWDNNQWVDCAFYWVEPRSKTLEWLRHHYGRGEYSVTWWKTVNSIWVKNKIYTHWKLCE